MEFTEEEVKEKLMELGYINVPQSKLKQFMEDLQELVDYDQSTTTATSSSYSRSIEYGLSDDDLPESSGYTEQSIGESYFQRNDVSIPPLQERNSKSRSAFSKEKVTTTSTNRSKHQIAQDKENMSDLDCSSTISSSHTISRNNSSKVRRKVSRKRDGETRIFDETFSETNSEATDITLLEDRMKGLSHNNDDLRNRSRRSHHSSQASQISVDSSTIEQQQLPAFIRSTKSHPHTRSLRKCDPVSRYHQFKNEWQQNKMPGESKHSSLRWQVREQMMSYEAFEKPRQKPAVNNYVVPTEKKRQALRWQVRTALANV